MTIITFDRPDLGPDGRSTSSAAAAYSQARLARAGRVGHHQRDHHLSDEQLQHQRRHQRSVSLHRQRSGRDGSFSFTVTTSSNVTPATSNTIAVGTSGATLSAASHNFGVNTTYTISNVPVAGLTTSQNVVTLSVVPAGTISLPSGAASYTVTYTPSGGIGDELTLSRALPRRAPRWCRSPWPRPWRTAARSTITSNGQNPSLGRDGLP